MNNEEPDFAFQEKLGEEFIHRKTQYSAETGRIIPQPFKSYQHKSHSQGPVYPQPFHAQELMVKYPITNL